MLNHRAFDAARGRKDLSRFLVHLTRDDSQCFKNGKSAQDNFNSIMTTKSINAYRSHCLFNKQIAELPSQLQKMFHVSCFTEVPLNQIYRLLGNIPGRKFCFESYGLVFTREFILENNGEPAIYVNGYGSAQKALKSVSALYRAAVSKENGVDRELYGILPLVNMMSKKYDFSWEREWRVKGSLKFTLQDIYCVILPEHGAESILKKLLNDKVACICPSYSEQRINKEIARFSVD